MVRLDKLVTALYFGTLVIAFAGVIVIASGNARPYVDPATLPFGPPVLIVAFAVLLVVGATGAGRLTTRLERRAALRAGLELDQGETDGSHPVFTGTRRGHPVRVRTVSDVGNDSGFTVTMVEALLSDRQPVGVVVEPTHAEGIRAVDPRESAARRDGVSVASDDPEFARRTCERLAPEVVSKPSRIGQVYAGDTRALVSATGDPGVLDKHESIVQRALPRDGSGEGVAEIRDELGGLGDVVRDEIAGLGTDAATVVHYTAGPILDGDELDRQVSAVVDVAEAVEGARESRAS